MKKPGIVGWDFHDKFIIVHAVFAGIATLLTGHLQSLPHATSGGIAAGSWSMPSCRHHLPLLTISFILAGVAVRHGGHGWQFTGKRNDTHHSLGLSVFILVAVEGAIGFVAHYTKARQGTRALPTLTARKNPIRHVHMFCGIAISGLLYAALYTGYREWDRVSDLGTFVPRAVRGISWAILAIEVAAYAAGWVREAMLRPNRARAEEASIEKMNESGSTESESGGRS
ncbi:hypothetical protein BD779DRAFT_1675245 [Infundibulicybe gibba]|nr:hypothetical protein BD779DRAFT_1675245 [Infundibulicybe gibba]